MLMFMLTVTLIVIAVLCFVMAIYSFINKDDRNTVICFILGIITIWLSQGINVGVLIAVLAVLIIMEVIRRKGV